MEAEPQVIAGICGVAADLGAVEGESGAGELLPEPGKREIVRGTFRILLLQEFHGALPVFKIEPGAEDPSVFLKIGGKTIQQEIVVIEQVFVDGKEIEIKIYDSLLQRVIGGGVCQIQNRQTVIFLLDQCFVHPQHLGKFIHDDVEAMRAEVLLMVVQKKPRIDIGFHDHLAGQVYFR